MSSTLEVGQGAGRIVDSVQRWELYSLAVDLQYYLTHDVSCFLLLKCPFTHSCFICTFTGTCNRRSCAQVKMLISAKKRVGIVRRMGVAECLVRSCFFVTVYSDGAIHYFLCHTYSVYHEPCAD